QSDDLPEPVADFPRARSRRHRDRSRISRCDLRVRELDLELRVEAPGPSELERALEQWCRPTAVAASQPSPTRGPQPAPRPQCQIPVDVPELGLVASCLLEMEAENLLDLDEVLTALLQPVGEALVQLRARRLGERPVGSIADEEVPKPERVVARELRPIG